MIYGIWNLWVLHPWNIFSSEEHRIGLGLSMVKASSVRHVGPEYHGQEAHVF